MMDAALLVALACVGTTTVGSLLQAGASAFFGGLFGALLGIGSGLVEDHLKRTRDRQRRHHSALIAMQFRLNEHLVVMSDDAYLIGRFRPAVMRSAIHWSMPRPLSIKDPEYLELLNREIINEYFALNVILRKINEDLDNILRAYGKVVDLYAGRRSPEGEYMTNALNLADMLEAIAKALGVKEQDVSRLLAKVRVLERKDSPARKRFWWSVQTGSVSKEELEAELKLLGEEMVETGRESRAEIDRMFGGSNP